jgi:raffinose/stachyose/melibiose transport system permease protein
MSVVAARRAVRRQRSRRAAVGGPAGGPRKGALWFALPGLLVYAAFLLYPALRSLTLSFTSWDGISPEKPFVGLENYSRMFEDPTVRHALLNNVLWTVVTVAVPMALGLALAVALNDEFRGRTTLRSVLYAPAVLPLVAVATIWAWMFDPTRGAVNQFLGLVGLDSLQRAWLGDSTTAIWATMVPGIWVRTGFPMLIYLAALQGIPRELYDSARVDGARAWQTFRYITLPSLRHAHYIILALGMIEAVKLFDIVYAMTYGGPGRSTQVLGTWMYFQVFQYYHAGYGTAIAVFITLLALSVGIPYVLRQTRQRT